MGDSGLVIPLRHAAFSGAAFVALLLGGVAKGIQPIAFLPAPGQAGCGIFKERLVVVHLWLTPH